MTKFNLILPAVIALSICSAFAVPAYADVTATTEGSNTDLEPTAGGYYTVDIDTTFDVGNTSYSPATIRLSSGLVIENYNYLETSSTRQVDVAPRTIQLGTYTISYLGNVYPNETFHIQNTATDITPHQPVKVLFDGPTISQTAPPVQNGGDG